MQQKNEKIHQFGFLFFATFGAACIIASVVVSSLTLIFSVSNNVLSFSSGLWIFMFLFPAAFAFSVFSIGPKIGMLKQGEILPMVIVGYGTYSLASLFILLVGGRSEPAIWALLVLILISFAMFYTEKVFSFFIKDKQFSTKDESNVQLTFDTSILPMKTPSNEKNHNHNKRPIFSIQNPSSKNGKDSDSEEGTVKAGKKEDVVIHLGPRE